MNDFRSTFWQRHFDDDSHRPEEATFRAQDVDTAIVHDGNERDLPAVGLLGLKDGRNVYIERHYTKGVVVSESLIVGTREACEAGIPESVRRRLRAVAQNRRRS